MAPLVPTALKAPTVLITVTLDRMEQRNRTEPRVVFETENPEDKIIFITVKMLTSTVSSSWVMRIPSETVAIHFLQHRSV